MNFSDPTKVSNVIDQMRTAENFRSPNRALIDSLANGAPPWTQKEAQDNHIDVNSNFGELRNLLLEARQQFENAMLYSGNIFSVRVPDAPKSRVTQISETLTTKANRFFLGSRSYLQSQRSLWGSVVLHGTGAEAWEDCETPFPYFIPIEDLLIPTDTELTLDNLPYFAVRRKMTPGSLYRKTYGVSEKNRDPGWQLDAVRKILDSYKDLNTNPNNWDWWNTPEKMVELYKQNATYYDSDSAPTIWFWDFYYLEETPECNEWRRVIILDSDSVPGVLGVNGEPMSWVYKNDKGVGYNINQVLSVQSGDGNIKPPFMYHSVRGLGMMLYDVCWLNNRLKCQFLQKTFEDLMLLWKVKDPTDRSRLEKVYLGLRYGIVPEGLEFVKRDERYTVDVNLIESAIQMNKQAMGEASASYKQDVDRSSDKEMTAREWSGRIAQVTKLTASMLNLAYVQKKYVYEEQCRRLTLPNSHNFKVKQFRQECIDAGVPEKWMDSSRWVVEPEKILGAGNMEMAQQQAGAIMSVRPFLNPEAQNRATHKYIFAVTGDQKEANMLAPLDAVPNVTDTVHDTEIVYGSFLAGNIVTPKPGLNPVEVVTTMIRLINTTVQQINQSGGVGTPQVVQGLAHAIDYAMAYVTMLAQDRTQKSLVKQLKDALGRLMNQIKAFAQRQAEMQKKQAAQNGGQNGANGDAAKEMVKLQADLAKTKQKLAASEAKVQQQMRHKEINFQNEQRRKNAMTAGDIQRGLIKTTAESVSKARMNPMAEE